MNIHDGNSINAFENTDPYMYNNLNRNENLNSMSASQNNEASQPSLNSNSASGQNQDGDNEQVSVYLKDNMIMRRIQIEGDDREFLMDP